jgi:hypothetical protein
LQTAATLATLESLGAVLDAQQTQRSPLQLLLLAISTLEGPASKSVLETAALLRVGRAAIESVSQVRKH